MSSQAARPQKEASASKGLWERLVRFLLMPTDPSNLAVCRIAFGLLMVLDIPQERGMAGIVYKFDPDRCHFPLIHGLDPLPTDWMHVVFLVMFLAAWGIMLGFFYRTSCVAFIITYWYVFFLGKATWNNHSYLYGLFGIMLLLSDANRYWSLDGLWNPQISNAHIPMANYVLFRFQVFLVYFYAGLKKIDVDWMGGYSMTGLSRKWVFAPFLLVFSKETVDLVLVHYCGLLFDLFEGFLLIIPQTRPLGFLLGAMFHTMNSQMFHIGMFAYTMLATMFLYCSFDWPKRLLSYVSLPSSVPQPSNHCIYPAEGNEKPKQSSKKPTCVTLKHIASLFILFVYIAIQLFLPYSHFVTKGYNAWTQGLYGYSWDMMVHTWSTQHLRLKIVDKSNGKVTYIRPGAYLGGSRRSARWSSHPDMIKQYVRCLTEKLKAHPEVEIREPEVYLDIWRSMNKRFQQRFVDPTVEMTTAPWSPFQQTPWVKPLLTDLSPWREKFSDIHKELREKSNFSHVVFVADFPKLHLENFVSEHLNASITVLRGKVEVEFDNVNHTLGVDEKITVPANDTHKVYVVSDTPACYMYIHMNMTKWNNETLRNRILHPDKRPVSTERSKQRNVTTMAVFRSFLMGKYYTFRRSFTNTFYALRHLITGIEPAMETDPEDDTGSDDTGTSNQGDSGRDDTTASDQGESQASSDSGQPSKAAQDQGVESERGEL